MRPLRTCLLLACVLAIARPSFGEIRPSFQLDSLAWEATHVVVLERAQENYRVAAAWTGAFEVGAPLRLPELAALLDPQTGVVGECRHWGRDEDAVVVSGRRAIVFLKQDGTTWKQAATWGGFRVSVAWEQDGKTYGFVQVINPGDAVLIELGTSPADMKKRVQEIAALRQSLGRIAAVADAERRALEAAPFTDSDHDGASNLAFEVLAGCGNSGVRVLKTLLQREEKHALHARAITTLGKAGGQSVGPYLSALLADETRAWRQAAPDLESGWWNGKGLDAPAVARLRERYLVTLAALRALAEIRHADCRKPVSDLRNFWRSLPQLEDKSGLDQMSETCDEVLRALE